MNDAGSLLLTQAYSKIEMVTLYLPLNLFMML